MSVRGIHYLSSVRNACRTVSLSLGDGAERRRLGQVCQVLNRLIVEARTLPGLQARAVSEYSILLRERLGVLDASTAADSMSSQFGSVREFIQQLLRSADESSSVPDDLIRKRVVEIERDYFQQYDAAFKRENSAATASSNAEGIDGDAIDIDALGRYLSSVFGGRLDILKLDTMALGFSKATFLVTVNGTSSAPGSLVIRMDRPLSGIGTTVRDEYPILQVLYRNGMRVVRPYALESTGHVLGQPFLVLQRIHGRNVGSHFRFPDRNPKLAAAIAGTLAEIHSMPVAAFGDALRGSAQSADAQFRGEIDKYYGDWLALKTVSPIMEAAFQWLRTHVCDAAGARTLVHGDFSLSNLLVDEQDEVSAVLDWEFAQLGNPASDLGWFYFGASRLSSWEDFLRAYKDAGGSLPDEKQLNYFRLWGAVRLAVMNYEDECGFESGRYDDITYAYAGASFMAECVLRVGALLTELLAE